MIGREARIGDLMSCWPAGLTGNVRLGRGSQVGVRACRARPGVRRAAGHDDVESRAVHRTAQEGLCGRQAAEERLSDMVRRVLRSIHAVGIDRWGPAPPKVDMAKHNAMALEIARQGIVLLKNDGGLLPLASDKPLKIAVIGGYAQLGVPIGTGSSAVLPVGGYAVPIGGPGTVGIRATCSSFHRRRSPS